MRSEGQAQEADPFAQLATAASGPARAKERSGFSRVGLAARRVPRSASPGPRLRELLQGLLGWGTSDRDVYPLASGSEAVPSVAGASSFAFRKAVADFIERGW